MKNLPRAVVRALSIAVVCAVCLSVLAGFVPAAGAATGTLKAAPSPIWAGNIVIGQTATLPCTLKNSGAGSLTISKAASSNVYYSLSSPKLPLALAAGKSVACAITFAPKLFVQEAGTITFTSNASNPTASISLNGWGVGGRIVASRPTIAFGSVANGGRKTITETLTNNGLAAVKITSANSNGSAFARTGISPPLTLAPSASVTFNVLFVPKTSGATTGTVTVLSNATDPSLTINLSGTGTGAGSLSVAPATASFGSVTVGSSKSVTETLAATGTAVVVSSATTTNSEFTLSGMSFPATIAAGKSASFTLKFAPTSSGATSAKISFVSNAATSPMVETVTGTGAAAGAHKVALQWVASTSAVTGYNVYRGTVSGGPYTKQNSSLDPSTSYTDSSVLAGQTYYYVVTSENSKNVESAHSNQVKAVIP
jgi:Abnormal spindle-like microcephaly-assoc'd, ASPM-SPD-2-Hydin